MEREKMVKTAACALNIAVILSAVMIALSMFMPYMNMTAPGNITKSLGSGWKYLTNESTSGRLMAYLVLCLIFAIGLATLGVLRLLNFPLFNSKILSLVFAGVGIMMLIFSVMTFAGFKDTSTLDITKSGAGLIVNLVFSIIALLTSLGSAAVTVMNRRD